MTFIIFIDFILNEIMDFKSFIMALIIIIATSVILSFVVMKRREVEHEDDKREVDQIRNSSMYEHNSIKFSYIWAQ